MCRCVCVCVCVRDTLALSLSLYLLMCAHPRTAPLNLVSNLISSKAALQRLFREKRYRNNLELN